MMARLCRRIVRCQCRAILLGAIYFVTLVFVANLISASVPSDGVASPSETERAVNSPKLPTPPVVAADRQAPDARHLAQQPPIVAPAVARTTRTTTLARLVPGLLINKTLSPQLPLASSGGAQNDIADPNKPSQLMMMRKIRNVPSLQTVEKVNETKAITVDGQPYPLIKDGNFIPMRRIVHFDLKGAPFKPAYFMQLFPFLARMNATGVLIEWEDMFPYTGPLASAVNGNAYTVAEVRQILQAAKNARLDIIPLVQTFGHLEWILKLEQFANLRENSKFPQVICFADEKAWMLIKDMVDQVAALHKEFGMSYFHMGADEAFQIGDCEADRTEMMKQGGRERVILWHIARTADHIASTHHTRVLAWHDMFANSNIQDLQHYRMIELVEPVIWSYAEDLDRYLHQSTWQALRPFPYVWGASAFKGADGPMRYHSNPMHYVRNNQAWIKQMSQNYASHTEFRGLILTGWSRYDHLAVLCEVLPVGMPALAMSLLTIFNGRNLNDYSDLTPIVGCQLTENTMSGGCQFPGAGVYQLINEFRSISDRLHDSFLSGYDFNGWLSRTAQKHRFSSAMYLDKILPELNAYLDTMNRLETELRREMASVFFDDAIEEFIYEYMGPDLELLRGRSEVAGQIKQTAYFLKRPFIKKHTDDRSSSLNNTVHHAP